MHGCVACIAGGDEHGWKGWVFVAAGASKAEALRYDLKAGVMHLTGMLSCSL